MQDRPIELQTLPPFTSDQHVFHLLRSKTGYVTLAVQKRGNSAPIAYYTLHETDAKAMGQDLVALVDRKRDWRVAEGVFTGGPPTADQLL